MGFWENITGNLGFDLGGVAGGIMNYYSQKETNKANRELAELAYQQNVEQWERENAYNHPAQQMSRLREAGLNPNLVYGNGSAVQTSAHSPQMVYPQMQAPKLDIGVQGFSAQNSPIVASQRQVNESVVALNNAKAIEAISSAKGLDEKTKYQAILNLYAGQRQQAEIDEINKRIENFDKQWKLWASQEELNTSIKDLNEATRDKITKEMRKLGVDIKTAEAIYDKWGKHGMTPAQGLEQLGAQMAWLGLQLPGPGVRPGDITVFDNDLPDDEFKEKFGYPKYSDKYWGQINKQLEYGNRRNGAGRPFML